MTTIEKKDQKIEELKKEIKEKDLQIEFLQSKIKELINQKLIYKIQKVYNFFLPATYKNYRNSFIQPLNEIKEEDESEEIKSEEDFEDEYILDLPAFVPNIKEEKKNLNININSSKTFKKSLKLKIEKNLNFTLKCIKKKSSPKLKINLQKDLLLYNEEIKKKDKDIIFLKQAYQSLKKKSEEEYNILISSLNNLYYLVKKLKNENNGKYSKSDL